ncbi:MAG TPA: BamA/TamA family outer membrane protein [Vicinamibacterales bacterium]|nr:BamA/TamA family outer membrane protein [Vicinamibacterales bacterium]
MRSRVGLLALVFVTAASGAAAQPDPVAAPPEEHQAEGSRTDRNAFITRLRHWADGADLLGRINGDTHGWYPRFGGIRRGAGLNGGPGLRGDVTNDAPFFDLSGAVSIKGYKAIDLRARWLQTIDRRFSLWTEFRYEDFPQEDFYGIGMSSTQETRTSYDFDSAGVRVRGLFRPRPWARLELALGFMQPDIGSGTDDAYPSTEDLFTDTTAPGLFEQPDFLHTTAILDIDYRDTPGNTSTGGFYHLSYAIWNDVSLDEFNFHRFDMQLVQFLPLTRDNVHVLSGRVGASTVRSSAGSRVPFYFLAYAGGMDTIRSFHEYRFKDENAMWMSAEYKWRPRPALSVAVFADAGHVSDDWNALALNRLRAGYGTGVGFHAANQTIVRVDVASGGGEGWQLFIKVRPAF